MYKYKYINILNTICIVFKCKYIEIEVKLNYLILINL